MSRTISQHLAQLAYARARLEQACVTAKGCDNREWWSIDRQNDLNSYSREINSLKQRATPQQLAEAREITNAPI